MNPDMDAIYFLSPEPHIIDCLMADFERRRYRKSFLVWTALLDPKMRRRIDSSRQAQEQLAGFETLSIDYFPRESHLITFRDPWSFPILYAPKANSLVRDHMQLLAQKVGFLGPFRAQTELLRLLAFVFHWASIPRSDTTELEIRHMKQVCFAVTLPGSSRRNWMHTRNGTRTSRPPVRDLKAYLS